MSNVTDLFPATVEPTYIEWDITRDCDWQLPEPSRARMTAQWPSLDALPLYEGDSANDAAKPLSLWQRVRALFAAVEREAIGGGIE